VTETEVFLQQVIYGLSNGMIIALVALGYTMTSGPPASRRTGSCCSAS